MPTPPRPRPWTAPIAVVLLAMLVAVAFLPSLGNGWVDWDDTENYLENARFRGLGPDQLRWALSTYHVGVYQPLSWMICGAEYLAFGMDATGYHLVSLIFHALNAGLLFVLVRALVRRCRPGLAAGSPGAVEAGAFLATALFAVHPLRVEVVAWNSCQQYLPAASFAILAALAYLRAHPADGPGRPGWAAASGVLLLLGMLCKAAAIGVAGALVVLDFYPLGRLGGGPGRLLGPRARGVWAEKVPFLAMAAYFSVQAVLAKTSNQSLVPISQYGIAARIAHASFGVFFYPFKTFVPTRLCTNYYLPEGYNWYPWPGWPAILGLLAVSAAMVRIRSRRPATVAAWAAYLVLLAPSLGAIRIGSQYAADRYVYFASMPWTALLAGGLAALLARGPAWRWGTIGTALALVAALGALSWGLTETWKDSEALSRQVLASNPAPPPETLNALGRTRARRGAADEAEALYRDALRRDPTYAPARVSLGLLRLDQGRFEDALAEFREAARLRPLDAEPHINLGAVFGRMGRLEDASDEFREALRLRPDNQIARENLLKAVSVRKRVPR